MRAGPCQKSKHQHDANKVGEDVLHLAVCIHAFMQVWTSGSLGVGCACLHGEEPHVGSICLLRSQIPTMVTAMEGSGNRISEDKGKNNLSTLQVL